MSLKKEIEIENEFVKFVEKEGGKAVKFSDPAQKGAPDRMVIVPVKNTGISASLTFFVEFKKPGEQQRPEQIRYQKNFLGMGILSFAAEGVETPAMIFKKLKTSETPRVEYDLLVIGAIHTDSAPGFTRYVKNLVDIR